MQNRTKRRSVTFLVLLVIVTIWVATTAVYTVKENEQGVLQTFGRYSKTVEAGLHWKLPWPLQVVRILPVQRTQKMELGYYQDDQGAYYSDQDDSLMITGDMNLVNIDFFLEWKISDPVKYLFVAEDPEGVLRNMLMSSVRSIVGTKTIDDTLTTGKIAIQNQVQELLTEKLEENDIGIQILDVKVNDSEPPTDEVAKAFRDVETAKQERDTAINRAREYENSKLPEARSKADQMIKQAEGYRDARIQEALGEKERYLAIWQEYKRYPDITRRRMYLQTLAEIYPDIKVIVDADGGLQKYLPLGPMDSDEAALAGERSAVQNGAAGTDFDQKEGE